MKHILSKLPALAAAGLFLFFCITPTSALSDGVYTAPVTTYYINQDTGVTDDGGTRNAALGEGMCRSAVYATGLVEVENGKTYVTIRMLLASNVKNVQFSVQGTPGDPDSYKNVSADILAENTSADSVDYRFEVPAANSYIGCSMYVTPMGRDVKFYMQVESGSAAEGSGDFVVSVSAAAYVSQESPEQNAADDPGISAPVGDEPLEAAVETGEIESPGENTPAEDEHEVDIEGDFTEGVMEDNPPEALAEGSASGNAANESHENQIMIPEELPTGRADTSGLSDTDGEAADTQPESLSSQPGTEPVGASNGGVIAVITILCVLAAGGGGLLLYRRKKTSP